MSQLMKSVLREENDIEMSVLLKPYTRKELCQLYNVSRPTMRNWLDALRNEIGHEGKKMFTISQVEIIFGRLGVPYVMRG